MPGSMEKLLDLLGVAPEDRVFARLGDVGRLQGGIALPPPVGIFPRYVEKPAS